MTDLANKYRTDDAAPIAPQGPGAPPAEFPATAPRKGKLARFLQARSTFFLLQLLDVFTTLLAFRLGAFEINPLIARFTAAYGAPLGLTISKAIAVLIFFGIRKRVWIINVFYCGIVFWNVFVLTILWAASQHVRAVAH